MAGPDDARIPEMLQMATRNHGLPLEALDYDRTPVGLHFLLTHFDMPMIDPAAWMLTVDGGIGEQLTVGIDDLMEMPALTMPVVMECAGNGRARLQPRPIGQPWLFEAVGQAEWTGVRLSDLLETAGVVRDAREVVFRGADHGIDGGLEQHYERSLPLGEAMRPDVILAHSMNGVPLPPQHGFPLRLVVPSWYGMASVKWLTRITASTTPFRGYQQARAYRVRASTEPGEPVTRILPRSLMIPPGIPDFHSRARFVDEGVVPLVGRAWSGFGQVISVEVSSDDGESWEPAGLEPAVSGHGWQRWAHTWEAQPGLSVLCSRATDETGRTQPDQPIWNVGGYQVNAVHRVPVEVRPR